MERIGVIVMNVALILSGGIGTRLCADIPKQYMEVDGKPILSFCIEQLSAHHGIDAIQIVAAVQWRDKILNWLETSDVKQKFKGFSAPGENRQLSIYHGLEDIVKYAREDDKILIHDAARPILSEKMISSCLDAIAGHDGVMPVLPMKDTVYFSEDGKVVSKLLERKNVFAGQAPEVFRLGVYYRANRRLLPDKILKVNGSTEPAILAGLDIEMISGDERNFKITTQEDLRKFQQLITEGKV